MSIYKRKQLDFDCVRPEAFHSRDSKWTKRKLAKILRGEEQNKKVRDCFWLI